MAEVIAAVGLGPQRVLVLSWMGFAGYMCMRKAVHFTVVGSITRLPRQIQECEEFRERVAVVSCYIQVYSCRFSNTSIFMLIQLLHWIIP